MMQLIQTLRLINPIVPDGLIDFPNPTEKCSPQWIEVLVPARLGGDRGAHHHDGRP